MGRDITIKELEKLLGKQVSDSLYGLIKRKCPYQVKQVKGRDYRLYIHFRVVNIIKVIGSTPEGSRPSIWRQHMDSIIAKLKNYRYE